MDTYDYIIIGASKAGLTAVETLREKCPEASLLLINGEDRLPYKRTELTKKLAAGFEKEDFALYPDSWYGENRIDRVDSPVRTLKLSAKEVITNSGVTCGAQKILIATGVRPRKIGIPGEENIHHLRLARETEEIRRMLKDSGSTLVIGQGVEGVEIAEQMILSGQKVTSLSSSTRLMNRWLDPFLSERLAGLLTNRGINLLFNRRIKSLETGNEVLLHIHSPSGAESLTADLVLASIGVEAEAAILDTPEGHRISSPRGIRCNRFMETEWPGVFAAGDVVDVPEGWATGLWHSAEHQGRTAALNMAGIPTEWTNLPVRLKCEVFGDFYFSMAYDLAQRETDVSSHILRQDETGYLKIFCKEDRLIGALMQGMKPFAKPLARLVVAGASLKEVEEAAREYSGY
ncbi:MAG: FAD-dependent oxidoreductase [Spirochaetales bacterium]|nr:FAD-dependent oxidoreductase [Spirochaetales bacterium]